MAHEIESMFFVGETPWHGLGERLIDAPSTEAAIVAAGLDWSVRKEPLYWNRPTGSTAAAGVIAIHGGQPVMAPITAPDRVDGIHAIVRESDNTVLGTVGDRYEPLQNKDAFKFFDPFVESGLVTLETAGSLRDGQRIWILARIAENSDVGIVGDDAIRKFIMLSNGHDGTMAIRVGFTPVRIVCANTLAMAHRDGQSSLLRIKHTRSSTAALESCREAMNLVNQSFEATAEVYRRMAQTQVSAVDLEKYVKIVLGHDKVKPEELSQRALNQIEAVTRLFEFGRGQQLKGVRGTVWAAYNAVTEYLTHEAGDNADKRYNSLWFGSAANRNALALTEAQRLVAA